MPERESHYTILPLPSHLLPQAGQCQLSADYKIVCQGKTPSEASLGELLTSMLRPATGFGWPIAQGDPAPNIIALQEDVLSEAIDLFPSPISKYLGGDECPKTRWKECQECPHRIPGCTMQRMTEYLPDTPKVEYTTYPHAIALAEATWSPRDKRNYEDFINRLNQHARRMKDLGLNYTQNAW